MSTIVFALVTKGTYCFAFAFDAFFIMITSLSSLIHDSITILLHGKYNDFMDAFKKRNIDCLLLNYNRVVHTVVCGTLHFAS